MTFHDFQELEKARVKLFGFPGSQWSVKTQIETSIIAQYNMNVQTFTAMSSFNTNIVAI